LPPRAYRAVKSSLGPTESHDDEEDVDDEDLDSSDVEAGDEIYKRIKVILDSLLKSGQAALEKQVKDFPEGGKGGAKVLSPEELKDYHGNQGQDIVGEGSHQERLELERHREQDQQDDDVPSEADTSFDSVGNDTFNYTSEDEVESMTIPSGSPPSSPPPPPILITHHNLLT